MVKHLERDLETLQADILRLAGEVETAVTRATEALRLGDTRLAQEVIDGDADIDEGENRIGEECLRLLAVHQPVAGDLRRVTAALMVATDLERMADLAEDIAGRAIALAAGPSPEVPNKLQRMADLTVVMVRQCLQAFFGLNTDLARTVCRLDDEVDRYNTEIIADLVEMMRADPAQVEPGLSLFSATRHLERIADHATNIAEDVIYLVQGEIVRHHPEVILPDLPQPGD
jgi:phosphate transport system protein